MSELYGYAEAERRARTWMPLLKTVGQRVVYGAMLMFCGIDGRLSPSSTQLAKNAGYHPTSVRRIRKGLEDIGCLVRVGSVPLLNAQGVAHGSKIIVYSIPGIVQVRDRYLD